MDELKVKDPKFRELMHADTTEQVQEIAAKHGISIHTSPLKEFSKRRKKKLFNPINVDELQND